ncbi:hypothetical protein F511_45324 [Dorcoceras hygrometricum]|uniref:Uncharacterized protein n=1 Tax=Dorcoceras hygrometricum TaxID=472368 RepID=A0A2Z6ZXH3_9LAMI|nr:hypothetical protein F511_45324 [Dorcoceras hygrometricum]
MLTGFTTEEAEADTVADQGLKRVNRIFGGLNEGIWPKTEELTAQDLLEEMSKKKMNSRSLESVAQELVSARMTSAEMSSHSAGSYSISSSTSLKRNQEVATVLPGVIYNEPAVATHPVVGKSSRELQCYCISSYLGTQTQEKKMQAKCRDSTSRELQYPVTGNPGAKNPVAVMNQQRSS